MSLCDDMGCHGLILQMVNADLTRHIVVENDLCSQAISKHINPPTGSYPRVDHTWKQDVFDIEESDIVDLGYNTIKQLAFGAPCQDQSKLYGT